MSDYTLITSGEELDAAIIETIAIGETYSNRLHVVGISVLYNAAADGNPDKLNRFFAALNPTMAELFKAFVKRIQTKLDANGNPVRDSAGDIQESEYAFLQLAKSLFAVTKGRMPQREAFQTFAEKTLINPKEPWKRWTEKNLISEIKLLGDSEILKQLKGLYNKANGGSATYNSVASEKVLAELKKAFDTIAAIVTASGPSVPVPSFDKSELIPAKVRTAEEIKAENARALADYYAAKAKEKEEKEEKEAIKAAEEIKAVAKPAVVRKNNKAVKVFAELAGLVAVDGKSAGTGAIAAE